jgi:hypothetical protein
MPPVGFISCEIVFLTAADRLNDNSDDISIIISEERLSKLLPAFYVTNVPFHIIYCRSLMMLKSSRRN